MSRGICPECGSSNIGREIKMMDTGDYECHDCNYVDMRVKFKEVLIKDIDEAVSGLNIYGDSFESRIHPSIKKEAWEKWKINK